MSFIFPPSAPVGPINRIVKITEGGTGADSREQALINLGAIDARKTNQPGGPLSLDSQGKLTIPVSQIRLGTAVAVNGPLTAESGVPTQYQITNYHATTSYIISTDNGTVTRNQDIITYTPGNFTGESGFTVNGKRYNIIVSGRSVVRPSVQVPSNNATNVATTVAISSNAFSVTSGTDTHLSTTWQLATDGAFTTIALQSPDDTTNKVSWPVTDLLAGQTYYLRARYKGASLGYSAWSSTVVFTTKAITYATDEIALLHAVPPADGDEFATALAVSGDGNTLVVGARSRELTGSAWVYVKDAQGWVHQARLIPTPANPQDLAGASVCISTDGNTVVIGAPGHLGKGAAFVFVRSGASWTQQAVLTSSTAADADLFGTSVALSGDGNYAVVGAPGKDTSTGIALVFLRSGGTWTQQTILKANDFTQNTFFGFSVAISSDSTTVAVGCYGRTASMGGVYAFHRVGAVWSQQGVCSASDGAGGDSLGHSVDISANGDVITAGAYKASTSKGAVYAFARTNATWSQKAKLSAQDGAIDDQFGFSHSLSANALVIIAGARNRSTGKGALYVFALSGNTYQQTSAVVASDALEGAKFGSSVSVSADASVFAVGSLFQNNGPGAVYLYS